METRAARSPALAAVLSAIVPGMGQMYAGEWRRGLAIFVGLPAQAGLFYGAGLPWMLWFMPLVWLWNIWDAMQAAKGRKASAAVPILFLLLLNVVAAWVVTQVQIPQLQPEQRGAIFGIIRGLATPDFFARKATGLVANAKYVVPGPGAPSSVSVRPPTKGKPYITVFPLRAAKGERVTVSGKGFAPNTEGQVVLLGAEETEEGTFRTDRRGRFRTSFANPRYLPGEYFVQARMKVEEGGWVISETLRDATPRLFETLYLALMGTAFSLIFALPLSFLGARNLMSASPLLKIIYGAVRALFTILRSVEVLIIAVIAVAAVGVGPFAGVIALAIHGVGAMGKLYSEAIESIDSRPIEAVRSTGATDLQVVTYAVVPQVVPQFIAFTLYRWDINVRMATVIGLVGGGGIGAQLYQYMGLLQWQQAATAIWLIAGVVMLMDYASAVIREKVI